MAFSLTNSTDYMAPTFALTVEGTDVEDGISDLIESIEYESADGMADVARIRAVNPDFMLSNAKVFQPGNEVAMWMGYGSELEYIGRVILAKQVPNFPQSGMPTIQAVGYTKDSKMMDNEPKKPKKEKGKGGRAFKDASYSDAVVDKAKDYGFSIDVDRTLDVFGHDFIQMPGVSDYEFVMGLANLNGYLFWVDGDDAGIWTLHFKKSDSLSDYQDLEYTFHYNLQEDSTLLSFQPEFLIKGSMTNLEVVVKDVLSGNTLSTEVAEENNSSPDVEAKGDLAGEPTGELTTASAVKLFFNDYSFSVNTSRRFKTQAEVEAWAKQWFRRMRENFVLSRGRLIGVGNLRARQIHTLDGLGTLYNGRYYFSKVKHVCSRSDGYIVDFAARKVVP